MGRLQFKVDENLPGEVVDLLREYGHDALSVLDQRLGGAEDPEVAKVCRGEGRILISLDAGFGDIRSYQPGDYPGIVVLRLQSQEKHRILDVVRRLIPAFEVERIQGSSG